MDQAELRGDLPLRRAERDRALVPVPGSAHDLADLREPAVCCLDRVRRQGRRVQRVRDNVVAGNATRRAKKAR